MLEPGRATRGSGELLTSAGSGYCLRLDPGAVDAIAFERLHEDAQARMAAGDVSDGLRLLDQALGLWRGEALPGVPGPFAAGQRQRLGELRVAVSERRIEALLELGRAGQVNAELAALVAEYPLRESLRGLWMLALYRTGRAAEALEVFRTGRAVLAAELGIEPGPGLQRLHQQILSADPALDASALTTGVATPGPVVPARDGGVRAADVASPGVVPVQLPHEVAGFVGRNRELAWLQELTATRNRTDNARRDSPGGLAATERAVLITAIDGCGGVGKTALALRFARQVAGDFPDGQLYVDLRGFDPVLPPMSVPEALGRLLVGLGADHKQFPEEVDALAGLLRSRLSGRRVLMLLDNAVSTEQVQYLLPGTPACLTLITSRNRLGALVARHGARRVTLDVLDAGESIKLLTELLGRQRAHADLAAVEELVDLCGGFPLALRIAAERLLARDPEPVSELVAELRDERDRLDLLTAEEDPTAAVRTVFSWSYHALQPEPARTFRLLALHPGPDFAAPAAAALAGVPQAEATKILRTLTEGHLLEPAGAHRFRMHDLLRLYAGDLTRAEDSDTDRDSALTRIFGHYLHSIDRANARIEPGRVAPHPEPPPPGSRPLDFRDTETALDWLDREQANLPQTVRDAHRAERHRIAWQLAERLSVFYELHRTVREWLDTTTLGLDAAAAIGDRDGRARLLNMRGIALTRIGDATAALRDLEEAKTIWTELGDRFGIGRAHYNIGVAYGELLGNYDEELSHYLETAELFHAVGNKDAYARALDAIGDTYTDLGRYEDAIRYGRQAKAISEELGNRVLATAIRANIAHAELKAGRPEAALAEFIDLIDHHRDLLELRSLPYLLVGRASCHRALGQYQLALEYGAQAIATAGDREPSDRATALYEMGHAHLGLGEPDQARGLWHQAITILDTLQHSRADQIRAELAALEAAAPGIPGAADAEERR